ncbi:hypothetical protein EUX98_g7570 [Antrodiella citrinella]|uniref:Uncharacterized protein n=1 Tax=Antrodiella citrinella TaxID=2447956 RepID=A0A4V3XHT5_9APHY|nr:hypothetical protein EUX98_g7570 [Antrodiella citrinella]
MASSAEQEMMMNTMQAVLGTQASITKAPSGVIMGMPEGMGGQNSSAMDIILVQATQLRQEARKLLDAKRYPAAIEKYKEALKPLLPLRSSNSVFLPLFLPSSEKNAAPGRYIDLNYWRRFFLMGCCNEIAQCYLKLNDEIEALTWLEESDVLAVACTTPQKTPLLDWIGISVASQDFYLQRITTLDTWGNIFLSLGNTGSALARKWASHTTTVSLPPQVDEKSLKKMVNADETRRLSALKHPDAALSPKLELKNKDLQIMGSWKKVEIPKAVAIEPRMGFCSFVWKSRFYVFGGEKSLDGPHFRDLRYLDLTNTNAGWHSLTPYPISEQTTGKATGWKMRVHEGKKRAYLFNSRLQLDFFDLENEQWDSVSTQWSGDAQLQSWPYRLLVDFSMDLLDDKIYIFAGSHAKCMLGCNLFVALDLKTLRWRRLSGYSGTREHSLTADWTCPGPRRHPVTWNDPAQKKIFVMFGEADRVTAQMNSEPHGARTCLGYGDLWSWDVKEDKWRKDRFHGNSPCARSEVSCTYNSKLNKTIVFGGYSPTIPCVAPENNEYFSYSYYADTFTYKPGKNDSSLGIWKQVLTRGFPTYRAQSHLVSDPATGKVFLFGGYTNSQFVRDKKNAIARSFADVWWLRMDVSDLEGGTKSNAGYFEGVDLEEEARTAKAGPWQRCFNCGSAGPWKKCGGSCRGKAFFCDSSCLKEGWKEHKTRHGCATHKK